MVLSHLIVDCWFRVGDEFMIVLPGIRYEATATWVFYGIFL